MKKGMDKSLQLHDSEKFPKANGAKAFGSGVNRRSNKSKERHPYMREGFVFPCCNKEHK